MYPPDLNPGLDASRAPPDRPSPPAMPTAPPPASGCANERRSVSNLVPNTEKVRHASFASAARRLSLPGACDARSLFTLAQPTAAEPPTPAKTAEPSSLQDTYAAGQTIPGDEMEKLLLQYTRAKEKLSTLERLYPGGGE